MDLRRDGWRELLTAENSGDLVMIAVVAGEVDPGWPKRKISRKKMDEAYLLMVAAVARAHAHFLAQRTPSSPRATRRTPAKVGRNDPCPCGSGLKFKKCCGGTGGDTLQ